MVSNQVTMEPKVFLKPGPFKQIFPYNTVISLYSCPLKIMHNIKAVDGLGAIS